MMIELTDEAESLLATERILTARRAIRTTYGEGTEYGIHVYFVHRQDYIPFFYGKGEAAKRLRDDDMSRIVAATNEILP